tara:strand:+ start:2229 stop:2516 length:288 start_codon:yes stop_codon:yes gene_type:complete
MTWAAIYTSRWVVFAVCIVAKLSSGCASTPAPETVKPVTVRVTASDFCPIMKAVAPPNGTLAWVPTDSPETIDGVRAVNAAVTSRCVPKKSTPTS